MNSLLIAQNILKRVFNNPRMILTLVLLPVVLIFGVVVTMKEQPVSATKIGIVNQDTGFLSAGFVEMVKNQKVDLLPMEAGNYISAVQKGKVSFVIVLPADFTMQIEEGRPVKVDFYSKAKNGELETVKAAADRYLSSLYLQQEAALQISAKSGKDRLELFRQLAAGAGEEQIGVLYQSAGATRNPGGNVLVDPAIGFGVMFMMALIFTTIGNVLEDKKKLTLARMFVSPVREWEIIAGNLLGSLVLGTIQLIPLVAAFKITFNISSFRIIAGFFLILFCFLISVIGIGIGISGLIKKSFNPPSVIAVVVTPTCILGGCFIPSSMLPDVLNKIGYVVPQKWVMDALQKVMGGAGLETVAFNLLIILLIGLTAATFGLKTLRPLND